jgi:Flp pilus assembly protein TadG
MRHSASKPRKSRRGIIAVFAAVLFMVMLGMVAFAVDVGYMAMMRTQLQVAADSAALAAAGSSGLSQTGMTQVAQAFAQYHRVAGRQVVLNSGDVQFGSWDTSAKAFSALPSGQLGSAVKVTVRCDDTSGGSAGLFFGKVFGVSSATSRASAVAMVNPRDICFVVDLSSSMRNDSLPGSGHAGLIQALYDDLFGAGHVTYTQSESGVSLTRTDWWGPLTDADVVANMGKIASNKPYMIPAPDTGSAASKAYWRAYFNYAVNNGGKISYNNYVKFMTDNGRDVPIIDGSPPTYTVLSVNNPDYLKHSELTDGGTFDNFPPREMPTHAVRRAMIAALQIIKDRNQAISDANQKDWVSIVAFDRKNTGADGGHVVILKSLTSNYSDVMHAAVTLQCCGGPGVCTDSEGGLILAYSHLQPQSQGGAGRENANKVVVFLTDGQPNLYESSDIAINNYRAAHPGSYWGSNSSQNAALMQASTMQGGNWYLYAVGIGAGGDQTFMNKMANMGGTAVDGGAYPIADECSTYETTLKGIFNKIVTNPKLRLVQ